MQEIPSPMQHTSYHPDPKLVKMATYASVIVAIILVLLKGMAWMITDSVGLQATLIDSILDGVASMINLVAVREALKPADKEHRFGHGKVEALAVLAQSAFISGSSLWLMFECFHRFVHPQIIRETHVGLMVMGVSMALTLILILFQNHVVRKTESTAIKADAIHYRSDFLINGGVALSLGVGMFYDLPILDTLAGALIALYILYTAWSMSKEAFHMLIDRELSDESRQHILDIAMANTHVTGVHDLRTRSSGSHKFIQLHLEMDGNLSLSAAHTISDDVALEISKKFPHAEIIIHQDPYQLIRDGHQDLH